MLWRHYDNTDNDFAYNDFTYNGNTYNTLRWHYLLMILPTNDFTYNSK